MFINNSLSQQELCHSSWSTGADSQPRLVSWETAGGSDQPESQGGARLRSMGGRSVEADWTMAGLTEVSPQLLLLSEAP